MNDNTCENCRFWTLNGVCDNPLSTWFRACVSPSDFCWDWKPPIPIDFIEYCNRELGEKLVENHLGDKVLY